MQDWLFQSAEFGDARRAAATIFFICPYSATLQQVGFSIRRLVSAGYHVVAYETANTVFRGADPLILPALVAAVRDDMRARIAKLTAAGGAAEFGFFGSSLGSFILYNCVGREIPEFRWGVFNTGGNLARGMWTMTDLRELHESRGWSLPRLEQAWTALQWPDFGPLDGCRFVFASSRRDQAAPLGQIQPYLRSMLSAGAEVSVCEVPAVSHRTTVIAGLWLAPRLLRKVRPDGSAAARLPAAPVHDLVERPSLRVLDRGERPVGRVAERDRQRPVAVGREAEQFPGQLDVGHARVTAADTEVGGGERHRHDRLAEVKLGPVELVVGRRPDHDDGRGRLGDVRGPAPHPGQRAQLLAVGDEDEVPRLPVLRGGGPAARLEDLVQVGRRDGLVGKRPDVTA
jgi:hypothetical protein